MNEDKMNTNNNDEDDDFSWLFGPQEPVTSNKSAKEKKTITQNKSVDKIKNETNHKKNIQESPIQEKVKLKKTSVPLKNYLKPIIFISIITIVIIVLSNRANKSYLDEAPKSALLTPKIFVGDLYFGDKILVDINDMKYGQEILKYGYANDYITNILRYIVRLGDTVVEVGASSGYYTIYLSRLVGDKGKIFSFEAREEPYILINQSLKLNDIKNVTLYNDFVYSSKIPVLVNVKPYDNDEKLEIITNPNGSSYADSTQLMYSNTINHILSSVSKVDVMYIKTNNSEFNVLLGANNIIARSPNIRVMLSINDKTRQNAPFMKNTIQQFLQQQFNFWHIDKGLIRRLKKIDEIMNLNSGTIIITKDSKTTDILESIEG